MPTSATQRRPQGQARSTGKKRQDPPEWPTSGVATPDQAAEFLQLGRTKIYEMMAEGQLPYVQLGRKRRISWQALHQIAGPQSQT